MKDELITSSKCYIQDTCQMYKDGRCEAEDHYCQRLHRLHNLYELALIPLRQRTPMAFKLDADQKDKNAYIQLKNFRGDIEEHVKNGDSLYIHSSICGNGKTEWALSILRTYLGKIWYKVDSDCYGLYVQVPRFLLALKENISTPNEYAMYIKDNVMNANLVVFDEIGTKGLTGWEHEQLLTIVNTRIDSNKSNIYTSNLAPTELASSVGPRLASRIEGLSENIQLVGADKRHIKRGGTIING